MATNTNYKDIFYFDEQQQRKLKKEFWKYQFDTSTEKIDTCSHLIRVLKLGKTVIEAGIL